MTIVLQKAIPPDLVESVLTQGFDRVGGYVVRAAEVSDVVTVAELRRLHHLDYPGSPFVAGEPIHILHVERSPAWKLIPANEMTERDVLNSSGTVEVKERLVEVFYLDHTRLTTGARLWRFEDGKPPELIANYTGVRSGWFVRTPPSVVAPLLTPTVGTLAVIGDKAFVAEVVSVDDGAPTAIHAVAAAEPPAELNFELNPTSGLWHRELTHSEVTALFMVRVTARWNSLPVLVAQNFKNPEGLEMTRVVSMARNWEAARDAGLHEIELGVWEATVPTAEVEQIAPQEIAPQPWITPEQGARIARVQQESRGGRLEPRSSMTMLPLSHQEAIEGTGDETHMALYQRIVRGVMPHIPEGSTKVQVLCQALGQNLELSAIATLEGGEIRPLERVEEDAARAFADLRALSADSPEGVWFIALVTISGTGQVAVRFEADLEPKLKAGLTAEMLQAERERFPRAAWPTWFLAAEERFSAD